MTSATAKPMPAGYSIRHRAPGCDRWAVLGVVPDRGTAVDVLAELTTRHLGEFQFEPVVTREPAGEAHQ